MATLSFSEEASGPTPVGRKQLLCHVVDGMAKARPEALYAEIPRSISSYEDGFRKITYAMLANVINGLSLWIHQTLGPAGDGFPTLAYIGPNDFRYNALILAAVKTGYKVLLTSPRNSLAAHTNLFNLLDCRVLITPDPHSPNISAILEAFKLQTLRIPGLDDLINEVHPHYPYNKKFSTARSEPLVVLHTSGTTGLPKPIIWTHDYAASFQVWLAEDAPEGFANQRGLWMSTRLFTTLPSFHAAGLWTTLFSAVFDQTSIIYPLSGVPPSTQAVVDGLKHTKADCVLLAPSLMDELAQGPSLLEFLAKNVDRVLYGGGNISQLTGDIVSKNVKLFTVIGSTEAGIYPSMRPAQHWLREEWNYFHFNPASGIVFRHQSDDQYEAVITRNEDPDKIQPVFCVFPDLHEWRSGDLYSPHPTLPHLWIYRARADDIIVFLSGEKTNPISMEQHISNHPDVRSVLVIGTLRVQAALLIELNAPRQLSSTDCDKVIESLWPTVQEANNECPRHARVEKSHILFTSLEKPMQRAGKGTVQRQPTLQSYAKEIDALYAGADQISDQTEHKKQLTVDAGNRMTLQPFIRDLVVDILGVKSFSNHDDFFAKLGMDSIQALSLTRALRESLANPDFNITTLYSHPSVVSLTEAICGLSTENAAATISSLSSRKMLMDNAILEYTGLIDNIQVPLGIRRDGPQKRTVILTGSTGAVGCYLLDDLVRMEDVARIHCFSRVDDPYTLQVSRSKARNLRHDFSSDRVTFHTTDLSQERFGLAEDVFRELHASVTDIIHNAWPVNFNHSLVTFKPSLLGVTKLIDFAATAPSSPSIMYISSISSVAASPLDRIPETLIPDTSSPLPMGYAQSKYLAERILDHAARLFPSLPISIARVGQVAGPANSRGLWATQEWFPSLVLSSLHLQTMPESLGGKSAEVVDWVPIDILAASLLELGFARTNDAPRRHDGALFFHPVNAQPTPWTTIIQAATTALSEFAAPNNIALVPFATWLRQVRRDAEEADRYPERTEDLLRLNPAIKLLAFYEGLAAAEGPSLRVDATVAVGGSAHLRRLRGVEPRWVRAWVEGWVGGRREGEVRGAGGVKRGAESVVEEDGSRAGKVARVG